MNRKRSRRKHIQESEDEEIQVPKKSKKRTLVQAGIEVDKKEEKANINGKRRKIDEPINSKAIR